MPLCRSPANRSNSLRAALNMEAVTTCPNGGAVDRRRGDCDRMCVYDNNWIYRSQVRPRAEPRMGETGYRDALGRTAMLSGL